MAARAASLLPGGREGLSDVCHVAAGDVAFVAGTAPQTQPAAFWPRVGNPARTETYSWKPPPKATSGPSSSRRLFEADSIRSNIAVR
jgi:hypothetical protein